MLIVSAIVEVEVEVEVEVGRNKQSVSGARRIAGNGRRCGLIPAYGTMTILANGEGVFIQPLRG
jgi:hypothetical protein